MSTVSYTLDKTPPTDYHPVMGNRRWRSLSLGQVRDNCTAGTLNAPQEKAEHLTPQPNSTPGISALHGVTLEANPDVLQADLFANLVA